jgi:hypothetical protein
MAHCLVEFWLHAPLDPQLFSRSRLILKRDMRSHHDKLKARRVRGMERLGHRHLLDLADARVLR